jgi:hypothetical protein
MTPVLDGYLIGRTGGGLDGGSKSCYSNQLGCSAVLDGHLIRARYLACLEPRQLVEAPVGDCELIPDEDSP